MEPETPADVAAAAAVAVQLAEPTTTVPALPRVVTQPAHASIEAAAAVAAQAMAATDSQASAGQKRKRSLEDSSGRLRKPRTSWKPNTTLRFLQLFHHEVVAAGSLNIKRSVLDELSDTLNTELSTDMFHASVLDTKWKNLKAQWNGLLKCRTVESSAGEDLKRVPGEKWHDYIIRMGTSAPDLVREIQQMKGDPSRDADKVEAEGYVAALDRILTQSYPKTSVPAGLSIVDEDDAGPGLSASPAVTPASNGTLASRSKRKTQFEMMERLVSMSNQLLESHRALAEENKLLAAKVDALQARQDHGFSTLQTIISSIPGASVPPQQPKVESD